MRHEALRSKPSGESTLIFTEELTARQGVTEAAEKQPSSGVGASLLEAPPGVC